MFSFLLLFNNFRQHPTSLSYLSQRQRGSLWRCSSTGRRNQCLVGKMHTKGIRIRRKGLVNMFYTKPEKKVGKVGSVSRICVKMRWASD